MEDCIYCKIIKGETETEIVKETDNLIVFPDINPQASIHLLIVPKEHVKDITEVSDDVWVDIKKMILQLAEEKNLQGFRIVNNAGASAMINHMHVHFLGDVSDKAEL